MRSYISSSILPLSIPKSFAVLVLFITGFKNTIYTEGQKQFQD